MATKDDVCQHVMRALEEQHEKINRMERQLIAQQQEHDTQLEKLRRAVVVQAFEIETILQTALRQAAPDSNLERLDSAEGREEEGGVFQARLWVNDDMRCLVALDVDSCGAEGAEEGPAAQMFATLARKWALAGKCNAFLYVTEQKSVFGHGPFAVSDVCGLPCVWAAVAHPTIALAAARVVLFVWGRQFPSLQDLFAAVAGEENRVVPEAAARMQRQIESVQCAAEQMVGAYQRVTKAVSTRRLSLQKIIDDTADDERSIFGFIHQFDVLKGHVNKLCGPGAPRCQLPVAPTNNKLMQNERLVARILQYYQRTAKWPTRKDLEISASEVRTLGGFRNMLAKARLRAVPAANTVDASDVQNSSLAGI